MEGVLMRGRDAIAVALRHPDGRIVTATERLDSGVHASPVAKWPFVRGLVVLYETLVIGTRWLIRSANVQAEEDDVELGKGSIVDHAADHLRGGHRGLHPAAAVHLERGDVRLEPGLGAARARRARPGRAVPRLPRRSSRGRRTSTASSSTTAPST